MINRWVSRSFSHQVTLMLLLVAVLSNATYVAIDFYQENNNYKKFMFQQALQLSKTLSHVVADDVHYNNHYELWEEINTVYVDNSTVEEGKNLVVIKEVVVIDRKGVLMSHTDLKNHVLNTIFVHQYLRDLDVSNEDSNIMMVEVEGVFLITEPIFYNTHLAGYILVVFDVKPLALLKRKMITTYLFYQLVIILIVFSIASIVSRKITSPVNRLIEAIPSMGKGDLSIKFQNIRSDEFKLLADTLEQADVNIYKTHQEIMDQQKKLTAILDNSNTIIYMKDSEGFYLLVNKQFEKLFNVRRSDVYGKKDVDLFSEAAAKKSLRTDQLVFNDQRAVQFEEVIEYNNEAHTYISVKFPVKNTHGEIYAACCIATDITGRKEIEDELSFHKNKLELIVQDRTRELNETIQEMESFSYSVSHDLRTPLRSINGFSRALIEDCMEKLNEDEQDYLSRIINATDRMSGIIDNLLLLSRVSRHDLKATLIDMSQLARNVIEQLLMLYPEREIKVDIQEGMTSIADPKLIVLLLENLLGNAIKYTSKKDEPYIQFACKAKGNQTEFFIKDNGAGFDMQFSDKLFKAFERLHGSEYDGSGIGLATVYRVIQRHNGRIWAESEIDKGAVFYFVIGE